METTVITDISEYKENILAGMNGRQLALSIIGIIIIILSYTTVTKYLPLQAASYLAIGLGLPCFLFAFARPHKMRLEQFLMIWLESELLSFRKRWYISENRLYEAISENDTQKKEKKTHGTVETKAE
ncbi:PrgI family protein [Christensenella timonensis]|uniref:PrgI family protein n=1 Tax=Christensenella timonensis TaxID=1816678 RepID=UPI00082E3124|nr:PrgI family protein [Christensenella timonensis]